MSDLNTEVEGSGASIRLVSTWLSGDLQPGLTSLGDVVATQRTAASRDWDGAAGSAFSGRAHTLATSADEGAAISGRVATTVGTLATALDTAQSEMSEVRTTATAGGLTVDGFWVRNPGSGPPSAGPAPATDAPRAEKDAWDQADGAVAGHNAKVEVWDGCVTKANTAWEKWQAALESGASAWSEHDSQYVGIAAQLLSAGIQLELIRRVTPIMAGEVDGMLTRAGELRAHAEAMSSPDGRIADRARYYNFLDEARDLENAHPGARSGLPNWELPKGLTRGLWALDVAAAGYGIYSDWEKEGPTQAITSNAVPAVASIASGVAAGAATGAVVGSFIPVPGVGTATGVVVGAGVGLVVGAFTSGAVDSLFDSGADTLGDWGGAVTDGVEEIGDTVSGVVEGVGGVFDSIF